MRTKETKKNYRIESWLELKTTGIRLENVLKHVGDNIKQLPSSLVTLWQHIVRHVPNIDLQMEVHILSKTSLPVYCVKLVSAKAETGTAVSIIFLRILILVCFRK